MKPGYIIEFKRKGFVSFFLGGLLKLLEKDYDGWGWHTAIAWQGAYQGWYVLEAIASGVKINFYSDKFLERNTRRWKWFEHPPIQKKMAKFLEEHIDTKYDVAIYFFTSLAIIIRHYFNRPIPKLLDKRFSCWELVQSFAEDMGKPIVSKYDVIIVNDLIKSLKMKK